MTVVDRPDNGQDEGHRHRWSHWRRVVMYFDYLGNEHSQSIAVATDPPVTPGWSRQCCCGAVEASGRAGAGEQHEIVASWLARKYGQLDVHPEQDADADADELLALLGGPQPDGEAVELAAQIVENAMGIGSVSDEQLAQVAESIRQIPSYLARADREGGEPCPVYSHGSDGWHCAVIGDHDQHTNAAGTETW